MKKNIEKELAEIRKTTDATMTEFDRVEKLVKKAYNEGKKTAR